VAQRLRNTVYHSLFPAAGKMLRTTVSVGPASYPRDARSVRDLVATADRRMRQDKELRKRS
jgi:GGDEF domain-containing protein